MRMHGHITHGILYIFDLCSHDHGRDAQHRPSIPGDWVNAEYGRSDYTDTLDIAEMWLCPVARQFCSHLMYFRQNVLEPARRLFEITDFLRELSKWLSS